MSQGRIIRPTEIMANINTKYLTQSQSDQLYNIRIHNVCCSKTLVLI